MDIIVLLLAAIFFFVVAILFRSNEALDRVGDVEKEVASIENEISHKTGDTRPVQVSSDETQKEQVNEVQSTHDGFPRPENVHIN